jgi:hypothetical protein
LHRRLDVTASLRLSLGVHTTEAEIDRVLAAVASIRPFFGLDDDDDDDVDDNHASGGGHRSERA